ncbi:MAG: hypothetical protein OHK0038_05570 [Flammeovirgaceae bacterium]
MKITSLIGWILIVAGLGWAVYSGYEAYQQQISFEVLGKSIDIQKQGSYLPALLGVGVAIVGAFLVSRK